jgi:nucleoside phosphorylase
MSNELSFDVCIVCALAEEAQAVLEVISRRCRVKFQQGFSARHNYEYRYTTIRNNKGEPLTLHLSWLPDKGPLETALHFKPILEEFRPRFVAMTGICAGDKRTVKLGDLIIADRAFLFDTGKIMTDENGRQMHLHNVKTYNADPSILQAARFFEGWRPVVAKLRRPASLHQQRDWLLNKLLEAVPPEVEKIPLEEREKQAPHWRRIVQELQEEPHAYLTAKWALKDTSRVHHLRYGKEIFPFKDPRRPERYIAPIASSNAVRSDNPFEEVQLPVREAVAIDMEGAAFYRTRWRNFLLSARFSSKASVITRIRTRMTPITTTPPWYQRFMRSASSRNMLPKNGCQNPRGDRLPALEVLLRHSPPAIARLVQLL